MLMALAWPKEQLPVLKSLSNPSIHLGPKESTRKGVAPALPPNPGHLGQGRNCISIWERAVEKARCRKALVPICCYLFPVCSPKYEPEVFIWVF